MNIERLKKAFADNQPRTEMTNEEMEMVMRLMLSTEPEFKKEISQLDKSSEIYKHFQPIIESFQIKIFLTRLNSLTSHRITLGALIMLSLFMESPGNCIMYLYYINSKLKPNTLITLDVISMDLFPWGFFSKEQLNHIWHEQKVERFEINKEIDLCHGVSGNMLDYNQTWGI